MITANAGRSWEDLLQHDPSVMGFMEPAGGTAAAPMACVGIASQDGVWLVYVIPNDPEYVEDPAGWEVYSNGALEAYWEEDVEAARARMADQRDDS